MLAKTFIRLTEWSPALKKKLWQWWYDYIARGYRHSDWQFMNYGYAYPDGRSIDMKPEQESERYCIQLYHYVAENLELRGKRVAEVGCGRGGGAAYIHERFQPELMIGVDYSGEAIAVCNRHHTAAGLRFMQGDAENLPIEDAAMDAVINVESSHCYGSMRKFLSEVERVLKPGGLFLLADLRQTEDLAALERDIRASGLLLVEKEDITADVHRAIVLGDERKRAFIKRLVNKYILSVFTEFAGVHKSKVEILMRNRSIVYQRFLLKKAS